MDCPSVTDYLNTVGDQVTRDFPVALESLMDSITQESSRDHMAASEGGGVGASLWAFVAGYRHIEQR
ncbi:hypothetical protein SRHO_G00039890 [Serrasalmus rhombeus]